MVALGHQALIDHLAFLLGALLIPNKIKINVFRFALVQPHLFRPSSHLSCNLPVTQSSSHFSTYCCCGFPPSSLPYVLFTGTYWLTSHLVQWNQSKLMILNRYTHWILQLHVCHTCQLSQLCVVLMRAQSAHWDLQHPTRKKVLWDFPHNVSKPRHRTRMTEMTAHGQPGDHREGGGGSSNET